MYPAAIALSPQARANSLAAMAVTELDVLVVGGGVVGAGTTLDAVARGLSTGLIEQRDLASGTSSRSSKLIHGGLRYLEMYDFALVKEALAERGLLLTRLAPYLVRPLPFIYPLRSHLERPYVGAGLALYDTMATTMAVTGKYDRECPDTGTSANVNCCAPFPTSRQMPSSVGCATTMPRSTMRAW